MSSPVEAAGLDRDEDADCRLRHGLNPDCLEEIFKYLDQSDMLALSKMNSHYKEIIVDRIIPFIQLNLTESCDQNNKQLMAEFGATVKSIKFKGNRKAFTLLMTLINDYCNVDQLKKINIITRKDKRADSINPDQVKRTQKYFRKLHFVAINEYSSNWEFLQELFALSNGIRVLHLKNVNLKGRFRNWTHLDELTDLTLIGIKRVHQIKMEKFIEFLSRSTRLQRYFSDDWCFKMNEALAEHCGKTIHTFGDLRKWPLDEHSQTRYDFLDKFENLKEITLTSEYVCMSDLYRPLAILAMKDSIDSLEIRQVDTKEFQLETQPNLPKFNNLKTLKLSIRQREHEAENLNEQMHLKFILNNANILLTNVQTLHLSGAFTRNMSTIIRLTPNLKRLSIYELEARRLLLQARRIVACIGHIIGERTAESDGSKTNELVYVTVCSEQWRDYAVFERNPIRLFLKGKRRADTRNFEIAGTAKIPKLV